MGRPGRPRKNADSSPAAPAVEAIESASAAQNPPISPASWGTFRTFVKEHGQTIARARFPSPPEPVIHTIWRGIPVLDGAPAVLRDSGVWEQYAGADA
ncbi:MULTISPECIES: hypothetical protein [Burkholderia cepacia complex]|uniref:Uncharacterized protein n=2 Tax=Burkholderia cepacia complex TaxID=87882 RepID=B9BQG6_9BURK|nr:MULTISPECIES: hypothetical protein [Burkholderia cepacia complex]EEE13195.1 hypothetical protein BURMUCGD2M_1294 [Burkholderia multivorans CGD2M]OFT79726.1 hypothetical protein HMPREF3115_23660 [Burkholderia sp. HMSC10F09]EEE06861.1 hypothetical protein BURMUCGD2_1203 [Burkholderia multivorans CGD2]MBJ9682425.1 hypothetical protein [Burkholderia multivorans]MBU9184364.1 hypothetical protein [Burkholderia multivorans]